MCGTAGTAVPGTWLKVKCSTPTVARYVITQVQGTTHEGIKMSWAQWLFRSASFTRKDEIIRMLYFQASKTGVSYNIYELEVLGTFGKYNLVFVCTKKQSQIYINKHIDTFTDAIILYVYVRVTNFI